MEKAIQIEELKKALFVIGELAVVSFDSSIVGIKRCVCVTDELMNVNNNTNT